MPNIKTHGANGQPASRNEQGAILITVIRFQHWKPPHDPTTVGTSPRVSAIRQRPRGTYTTRRTNTARRPCRI